MRSPRYPRAVRALMLAPAIAFALPARAPAQVPAARAGVAIRYESYSFGSPSVAGANSMRLFTIPFAARATIARGLTLEAGGAAARATVVAWGSSFSLSGLTDTELRGTYTLERGRTALALAAVGLVPSGRARLTLEEAIVAGAVASDLLPFRVSNWGGGGGAAVDVSAVQGLEGGSVGVAASYRVAGEFQPLDALDVRYQPGNELRIGVGLDRTLPGDRTLTLQLSYSRFGEDQWAGVGLLHPGARALALGSYTTPVRNATVSGFGGVLYRSGGALGDAILWTGIGSGIAPPSEALLLLGASARVPWQGRLLLPSLDFRLLRRDDGTGQGLLLGIGSSAELPVGDGGVRMIPTARLRLGRLLVAEGAESAVRGFELGLGLQLGGAR